MCKNSRRDAILRSDAIGHHKVRERQHGEASIGLRVGCLLEINLNLEDALFKAINRGETSDVQLILDQGGDSLVNSVQENHTFLERAELVLFSGPPNT
jgi:hypothetical protein